jgi:hypothetical protein
MSQLEGPQIACHPTPLLFRRKNVESKREQLSEGKVSASELGTEVLAFCLRISLGIS